MIRICVLCNFIYLSISCGLAQTNVLAPGEMHKLVPYHVRGFSREQGSTGKLMKIGDLRYSLCEQKFKKGSQKVKVLLFDFNEASIMYTQATAAWKNYIPISTDSVTMQAFVMTNGAGWRSFQKNSNTSQISIGINDRFLLMITGENVDLETLKIVLDQFHFELFPN